MTSFNKFALFVSIMFLMFATNDLLAQNKSTLVFKLDFSQSEFKKIQRAGKDRGIKSEKFGDWIANNGKVSSSIKGDGISIPKDGQLTLYLVDASGSIIGEQKVKIALPSTSSYLSKLARSGAVSRSIGALFPDSFFFPDSVFFPDSFFFPDSVFNAFKKMAAEAGRKAITRSDAKVKQYAIVVMVTPSENLMKTPVKPGVVVFVGHS